MSDPRDDLAALIETALDAQSDYLSIDGTLHLPAIADAILAAGWRPQPPHPNDGPMTVGGHWWVDVPLPDNRGITICKYCGTTLDEWPEVPAHCPHEWLTRTGVER